MPLMKNLVPALWQQRLETKVHEKFLPFKLHELIEMTVPLSRKNQTEPHNVNLGYLKIIKKDTAQNQRKAKLTEFLLGREVSEHVSIPHKPRISSFMKGSLEFV